MTAVTLSPGFRIVIPKVIRDALKLRLGQKMRVMLRGGRIELLPERDLGELRGILDGCNLSLDRDGDRV